MSYRFLSAYDVLCAECLPNANVVIAQRFATAFHVGSPEEEMKVGNDYCNTIY